MITCPLPPASFDPVDYEIAAVPAFLAEVTARGVLWQATSGRFWLEVPSVARYLVEHGRHIGIAPSPGAEPARVTRFLRMTPLAALLYQRGVQALHAAAVTCGNGAVLLAGDSGAGKSALLAGLLARGWTMLADELAIVDRDAADNLSVWPTFPEMVLWQETLDRLPDGAMADRFQTDQGRYVVRADRVASAPLPLRRIYWLSVQASAEMEISDVSGTECFQAMSVLGYNSHIAEALLDRAAHFRIATALARQVSIRRIGRPRGRWTLDELVARVIDEDRT